MAKAREPAKREERQGKDATPVIGWKAQPKQEQALSCPVYELFYGGAKGGGKSDFLLMDCLKNAHLYKDAHRGVLFRRTYPELEELQLRASQLYPPIGATYAKGERTWTFPGGGTLKMRHLERDEDVHSYQGHQFSWLGYDELTDWKTDYCYVWMQSCARSPEGVPVKIRAAGNPGGVGHVWVRQRFVDIGPPMQIHADPDTGLKRIFIPAKLDDNRILMDADPNYENRLKALPDHLYRAYRLGDWDIFAGQVFQEWRRDEHMVRPFALHPSWFRFASLDWGYAKPYSLGWWCVTGDGRMIRYREWYGCEEGKHNVGIRRPADDLAAESFAMSTAEGCDQLVMDPACWSKIDANQRSIADIFAQAGWTCIPGDNDRKSGCARLHTMLQARMHDGQPALLVFDTCRAFARTIPALVADDHNPEDVDTSGEDHGYDETRYALMSKQAGMRKVTPKDATHRSGVARYDPLRHGLGRAR